MTGGTRRNRRIGLASALAIALAMGAATGWLTAPSGVAANHSFNNQTWDDCGPYGCIGWKQFAETPYGSVPTAHMDNGGSYCGSSLDYAWAYSIIYWNGAGTVASFNFPVSDCSAVSYPDIRILPYTVNYPAVFWIARVLIFDQDPSTGAFSQPYCLVSCDDGENSSIGAQYGYDLSYVEFNVAKSPSSWEWVARHEIGHVVGLQDHHLDPYGCNGSYFGLMDDAGCDTNQLTAAEKDGVGNVHDR